MTLPHSKKKDESAEAFEAFTMYRDLGVGRSIRIVAEELSKSETLLNRWSSKHTWRRRAHSWDAELDRRKRHADVQELEKMRRRQIRLSLRMQEVGTIELEKMLKEVQKTKVKRSKIDERTILKLIEQGTKLERLNRGEPGEIVQSTGEGGAMDLTALTTTDLKSLRRMRSQIKQQQLVDAEAAAEADDDDE